MKKELNIEATLENLDTVLGFIEENLELAECPMKIAMKVLVCVEELFVNVVNYAYDGLVGPCGICFMTDDRAPGKLTIVLSDQGKEFNPLEKENPNITLGADARDIGGLGIFMVKNIMDAIYYERNGANNTIIMEKLWEI